MSGKKASRGKTKKTKEPELVELGQRIKECRIKSGYTSAEIFAFEHQISRTVYARYEAGSNITYMSLCRLLKIFGVSPQEFFEGFRK